MDKQEILNLINTEIREINLKVLPYYSDKKNSKKRITKNQNGTKTISFYFPIEHIKMTMEVPSSDIGFSNFDVDSSNDLLFDILIKIKTKTQNESTIRLFKRDEDSVFFFRKTEDKINVCKCIFNYDTCQFIEMDFSEEEKKQLQVWKKMQKNCFSNNPYEWFLPIFVKPIKSMLGITIDDILEKNIQLKYKDGCIYIIATIGRNTVLINEAEIRIKDMRYNFFNMKINLNYRNDILNNLDNLDNVLSLLGYLCDIMYVKKSNELFFKSKNLVIYNDEMIREILMIMEKNPNFSYSGYQKNDAFFINLYFGKNNSQNNIYVYQKGNFAILKDSINGKIIKNILDFVIHFNLKKKIDVITYEKLNENNQLEPFQLLSVIETFINDKEVVLVYKDTMKHEFPEICKLMDKNQKYYIDIEKNIYIHTDEGFFYYANKEKIWRYLRFNDTRFKDVVLNVCNTYHIQAVFERLQKETQEAFEEFKLLQLFR